MGITKRLLNSGCIMITTLLLGLGTGLPTPVHGLAEGGGKVETARKELNILKSALDRFRADTAAWPNRVDGSDPATNSVEVLYSEGNMISSPSTWPVDNPLVYKQVIGYFGADNDRNYPEKTWKGPYLTESGADPWGNTYLIGVKTLEQKNLPVWILSAGPDGIIQTPIDSPVCMDGKSVDPGTGVVTIGDDICLKYK